MARQNKILDSGLSQTEIMTEWNAGGTRREALVELLGFASSNGLYNALRAIGYIAGGPVSGNSNNGNGGKRSGGGKIKGCLPIKVQARIAKVLGLDMETDDIGWNEWLLVSQGDDTFEGLSMSRMAGGEDSEGGKAYRAWIDSNRANDRAVAEAAARAADPMFKLNEVIKDQRRIIADLESELGKVRAELETAKRATTRRGPQYGGELTNEMLRIMKQRFHPDKNNGSPELCTAVMQWLNAIEL